MLNLYYKFNIEIIKDFHSQVFKAFYDKFFIDIIWNSVSEYEFVDALHKQFKKKFQIWNTDIDRKCYRKYLMS